MRLPLGLDGPSPVWPRPVDAALESWAALSGRSRAACRSAVIVVIAVASSGGLVRGPHGPAVPVVVARSDIPAGAIVDGSDLASARWPADLVPPDALAVGQLDGTTISTGLVPAGAVLTERHLSRDGPGAFADETTAVVPLPADMVPVLPVGARVDLASITADGRAAVVARAATVVADDGTWRWVRVPRQAVADVAGAVSRGSLSVAVLSPAPPDGVP